MGHRSSFLVYTLEIKTKNLITTALYKTSIVVEMTEIVILLWQVSVHLAARNYLQPIAEDVIEHDVVGMVPESVIIPLSSILEGSCIHSGTRFRSDVGACARLKSLSPISESIPVSNRLSIWPLNDR